MALVIRKIDNIRAQYLVARLQHFSRHILTVI